MVVLDIAAQAAAGFVERLFGGERDHGLVEALHAFARAGVRQCDGAGWRWVRAGGWLL